MSYRDPTPQELLDPTFESIWQAIKSWDINVPEEYGGYTGATGNHVCAILDAVKNAKLIVSCECGQALLHWWKACHMCGKKRP